MPRGRPKGEKRVRLHATVLPETIERIDELVTLGKRGLETQVRGKTRGKVIDARFRK